MTKTRTVLTMMTGALTGMALVPLAATATLIDPRAADDDIVVTGTKTTKAEIASFIKTTMAPPKGGRHDGQYARFTRAVCPTVIGLSDENKQQVEQRMRGVALAADMRVAGEGCKPNVFVMVVKDGDSAIKMLRKKRSRIFGTLPLYQREQLAASGGPAYAWKRIQTSSAETGAGHNPDETTILPTDDVAKTEAPTMISHVKSRIKRSTEEAMTHAFLLLEKDALVDLTTVQIADYAAMRSYIDTPNGPSTAPPAYSILSLFDTPQAEGKAPAAVSEMDLLLLSSLYSSPADVSAAMQSAAMAHKVKEELLSRPAE